jgi:hypothetical protein
LEGKHPEIAPQRAGVHAVEEQGPAVGGESAGKLGSRLLDRTSWSELPSAAFQAICQMFCWDFGPCSRVPKAMRLPSGVQTGREMNCPVVRRVMDSRSMS